jgi:predicted ribosome quality control (RQC) complex YloA/Tae2 family protein
MDIFFIEALVGELSNRICGARIDKIHQPEPQVLILRLWSGREDLRLLLSVAPGRAAAYLTAQGSINPQAPPRFCQLLRARLSRIAAVEQVPGERIIRFACMGKEGEEYLLIAELTGSRSNLLLLDAEGKIVDSLHRDAGGREALPGQAYLLPPAQDRFSLAAPLQQIPDEAADPEFFRRWLLSHCTPMSPLIARDLAAAVAQGSPPAQVLEAFRSLWLGARSRPAVGTLDGKPILTPFALEHLHLEDVQSFDTPSEAAEHFYKEMLPLQDGAAAGSLREIIRRARKRLNVRLEKIAQERGALDQAGEGRILGELLLANLHRVRRGMTEVTVENWYADPSTPLVIPLDPLLSPQENAERLFRGYKKKKRGAEHTARRLEETAQELAWLEEVSHALDEVETREDLLAVRLELEEGRLIPATPQRPRRRAPDVRSALRKGRSPGGHDLIWGKNNRTNDFVSREMTSPEDMWFHAHHIPGCHLVLKRKGHSAVPEEDILYAAALAAGYSRGRNDLKVEVMVAEGKWVRKPKGARPGLVTVEKYRTVVVKPLRIGGDEG